MSATPDKEPFSESHLDSPEYRQRLMRKLNCLIAVLEVACAKVRRSLAGPDPDVERLTRIHKNLRDTLEVCRRAKKALERREKLPENLPRALTEVASQAEAETAAAAEAGAELASGEEPRGAIVEMTSAQELAKFRRLGPIGPAEIEACNFEDLAFRLFG